MLNILKNERGFAMVYGLVVLLLASITGTGLMFMSMRGRIGSTDYAQIRAASQAAVSGLKACEAQFLNDPVTALAILQQYKNDDTYQWLFGDENNSNTEHKIQIGNGSEYSARILGFDATNYFVKIESIGYRGNGGKKRAVASYQLGGLGLSDLPVTLAHGLFLGGRMQNANGALAIKGDVYFRMFNNSNQQFNKGIRIDGNFQTAQSTATLYFNEGATITGTAFFQCRVCPQGSGPIRVYDKAGFTGGFENFNTTMKLHDDAYFISPFQLNWNNMVDGQNNGKTVRYRNPVDNDLFTGFGSETYDNDLDADEIAEKLGTTANPLPSLGLNLPTSWEAGVVQNISSNVSGSNLEDYWEAHRAAGTLYQDKWLVLNMTNSLAVNGGDNSFTKKSIWITNNNYLNGEFFLNASTTLIIINDGWFQMKLPANCNFRGLIYAITTGDEKNQNYNFGDNAILYGSIYHANQAMFNIMGEGDSIRIYFKDPVAQSAIKEIMNTGIILPPGAATLPDRNIELIDKKIRPTLLGMQL